MRQNKKSHLKLSVAFGRELGVDELSGADDGVVVGNVHASRAVQRSPVPVEGVEGPQEAENLH